MIKNSIRNYGQYKPLIVDKQSMVVLVGNGRLQALKELGFTFCKCILIDSNEQITIIDNRLNELSEWNDKDLQSWLIDTKGLQWWGIDSSLNEQLIKKQKRKHKNKQKKEVQKEQIKHICPCCGGRLKKRFEIS